jgi:hypothetical protein
MPYHTDKTTLISSIQLAGGDWQGSIHRLYLNRGRASQHVYEQKTQMMKSSERMKSGAVGVEDPEQADSEARSTRLFFRIAAVSTAVGLGFMAATMESVRGRETGFSFELSLGTLAAFAVGGVVGLVYWALVARGGWWARGASVLLAFAGVGAFLYPLRFVPPNVLQELAKGFFPAVGAIAVVVGLLLAVVRFLDSDTRDSENAAKSAEAGKDSRGRE